MWFQPTFSGKESSAETLQQNKIFRVSKNSPVKKYLGMFGNSAENKDDYRKCYEQFGKRPSLGVHEDSTIRPNIAKLLRFHTSKSGSSNLWHWRRHN